MAYLLQTCFNIYISLVSTGPRNTFHVLSIFSSKFTHTSY